MNRVILYLVFLLLSIGISRAQDQQCEGADCPNQAPQIEIRGESDVTKAAIGLPGGVDVHPNTVGEGQLTRGRSNEVNQGAEADQRSSYQLPICPGPMCPHLVAEDKTEFQKFVFTTTGERLRIFGRNLFENTPTTFAPLDHVPVPSNYVVGPSDELAIRAWGQVDMNVRVVVDRNGQVFLPRVGTVNVAGVRYDQLTGYLQNTIGRVFKNFDLNVTLGRLRSIQIFVVGNARRPGTYTVSSLSTLVTALFASGGPSVSGSMRNIQLKRQNQIVAQLDLYDLLCKGDKSGDAALLPGDVIYIPPVMHQVALMGSVNLPGIYEVLPGTTIKEQIAIAGGLSTTADGTRVAVERIENRTSRTMADFKLDDVGLVQTLKDGDMIRVFPVSPRVEQSVILRGSVALPGRYPWREGMRVADLIPSKGAILTRDYWMKMGVLARNDYGWLNPESKPNHGSSSTGADSRSHGERKDASGNEREGKDSSGNEREGKDSSWSDGRLENDSTSLVRIGSEINWDYAVIQRLNQQDLSSELLTFNLGNAIASASSADNILLQPGDVITIFSQADLKVPVERRTKFVWVEGEVKAPGVYRLQPDETLRDLILRTGGLMPSAYLYAAELTRVSAREQQEKRLNEAIDQMERELRVKAASILSSSGSTEDQEVNREQLQSQQELINRLKRVQVTGRIVLAMRADAREMQDIPAITLEDGDRILIPSQPATVTVLGAVYNQSALMFRPSTSLNSYLAQAGGPTRESDRDRMFVIRADGGVVSSQMHRSIWSGGFGSLKMLPGDTIVIPQRIKTGSTARSIRDWTQIFSQFALGAAALSVIAR